MKAKPPAPAKTRKTPRKITPEYLKNAGAYYLGRYASTTQRFREVMRRKIQRSITEHGTPNFEDACAWLETVILDFVRLGYLNDALFSKTFTRTMQDKGLSARKISIKLSERGIDVPLDTEIDDLRQILIFLKRKRWGIFSQRPDDPQKLLAKLARHGFSYSVCQQALQMSLEEMEEHLNQ